MGCYCCTSSRTEDDVLGLGDELPQTKIAPPKFNGWNLKMLGIPSSESPNFQGLRTSGSMLNFRGVAPVRKAFLKKKNISSKPGGSSWGVCICGCVIIWVVVWNIFYFHPYLGEWSNLTNIFSNGLKPPTSYVFSEICITRFQSHPKRSSEWIGVQSSLSSDESLDSIGDNGSIFRPVKLLLKTPPAQILMKKTLKAQIHLRKNTRTRLWFQRFFSCSPYVHLYLGKIFNSTSIFFRWVGSTTNQKEKWRTRFHSRTSSGKFWGAKGWGTHGYPQVG